MKEMTAEIAILNKSAVALAADSKATIGGGRKTFDTVNKIFTLSKVHPIGAMIFGNAEFMSYPWETIVKLYRARKRDSEEPTVAAWGNDFIKFLRAFGNIRPSDKDDNIATVLGARFYEIYRASTLEARERGVQVPSDDFTRILCRYLERERNDIAERKNSFPNRYVSKLKADYGPSVDGLIDLSFGGYKSQQLMALATDFSWTALQKKTFSPVSSGIVFAGFGEDEFFPTIVHYDTDGYIGDRIKIEAGRTADITRDMFCSIQPFAQIEMVQRFMNGIDPEYGEFIHQSFIALLVKNCLTVLDMYGKKSVKTNVIKQKIVAALAKSLADNMTATARYQMGKFSEPIVQMVSLLPKDELPHLAESLVALTSLKRHVSHDVETVGGPIDVALISKGDGFIWIKRKHYFRAEQNLHFQRNYLRDVETGGKNARKPAATGKPARTANR